MRVKISTALAISALLAGCVGSSDDTKELRGTWSTECLDSAIATYIFDSEITLNTELYSDENCTEAYLSLRYKFNAFYDLEPKITSSGVEALKVSLTLASNIMLTPGNSDLIEVYNFICPEQNWVVNQATSIMACDGFESVITPFETTLPMLLYIDGNHLYTSNLFFASQGDDGFPNDVSYDSTYIKQ